MAERRPLVLVAGAQTELPAGDTLPAALPPVTTLGHTAGAVTVDVQGVGYGIFAADVYVPGQITFVGGLAGSGSFLPLPAMQEGDVCVLVQSGSSASVTPAGWTEVIDFGSWNPRHTISYKVMGATPDTTVPVDSSSVCAGVAFRGVDPGGALDAPYQVAREQAFATTAIDPPPVTTVTDGAVNLAILAARIDAVSGDLTGGSVAGYTMAAERRISPAGQWEDYTGLAYREVAQAGLEDPPAHSESRTPASYFGWHGYSLPLRPAPGQGEKDYTFDLTNRPAAGTASGRLEIELKTATGSVGFTGAHDWLGAEPGFDRIGKYLIGFDATPESTKLYQLAAPAGV